MNAHQKGLWNEEQTIKVMQKFGLLSSNVRRLGGTQNKADWVDGVLPYTAKHQDCIIKGGFQWLNTSRVDTLFGSGYTETVKEIRDWYVENYDTHEVSDEARAELANLNCSELDNCSAGNLAEFLQKVFVEVHENFQCVITESPKKRFFLFPMEQHPVTIMLREGYEPKLQGNADSSRTVVFQKGKELVNCGLRVHLGFNNGTKSFFGVGGKRSGSSVIKLRQISLPKMLELSQAKVYSY